MEKPVPISLTVRLDGQSAAAAGDEPTAILSMRRGSDAELPLRVVHSRANAPRLRQLKDPEILARVLSGLLNLP
jgi:hypothetical protein